MLLTVAIGQQDVSINTDVDSFSWHDMQRVNRIIKCWFEKFQLSPGEKLNGDEQTFLD